MAPTPASDTGWSLPLLRGMGLLTGLEGEAQWPYYFVIVLNVVTCVQVVLACGAVFFNAGVAWLPTSEGAVILCGQGVLWYSFLLFTVPYALRINGRRRNAMLIKSIADHPDLAPMFERYVVGAVVFSTVLLFMFLGFSAGFDPGTDESTKWLIVSFVISSPISVYPYVLIIVYCGVVHAIARLMEARAKWVEEELVAAIRGGQLDETVALRVIRSYGSLIVTLEQLSGAVSSLLLSFVAPLGVASFVNIAYIIQSILNGELPDNSHSAYWIVPVCGGSMLLCLSVPAKVSAAMDAAGKRLKFVCSGALDLNANGSIASVSVSASVSSATTSSASSQSRNSGSNSNSDSDSDSGNSGRGRGSRKSRTSTAKSSKAVRLKQMNKSGNSSSSGGGHAHQPLLPIPRVANGYGTDSVLTIADAALHPGSGVVAQRELDYISRIAVHIGDLPPAMELAGLRITNELIARILYTAVSVLFIVVRLAAGSV